MKKSDFDGLIRPSDLIYKETTVSTNDDAKGLVAAGAAEGTTIVAAAQSGGRGRQTKGFFSPDTGAYFSVILKPNNLADIAFLTVYASLAVCDAAAEVYGVAAGIKWVNDVYLCGKKCAGILTEAQTAADGSLVGAVVGIGVNVLRPENGFPDDIKERAGYLTSDEKKGDRARFIARTRDLLIRYYKNDDSTAAINAYREKSVVIGKRIRVEKPDCAFFAQAEAIDDDGRLIVIKESGERVVLDAADVSICTAER